jgi:hypothetical protein
MLRMKYVWTLMLVVMLAAMASSVAFATPWTALQYDVPLTVTSVPVPNDFTEASFDDVATDYWAWAEIEECAGAHTASSDFIVQGYGGGLYEPTWQVTRAQMAVFIARAAGLSADVSDDPFPDVGADYWAAAEIQACVDDGVVQGYDDGLYRPTAVVDRAQMAVFIQRAAGLTTEAYVADTFADVDDTFWAASEIQACVTANIVQGYDTDPPTYLPDVAVTRSQMAVFVWRALVRYTGGDVVLGGPAVTDDAWLDPGEDTAQLWYPDEISGATGANTVEIVDDEEVDLEVGPGAVVFVVLDAVQVNDGDVAFEVFHLVTNDNGTPDDESDDFDEEVSDGGDSVTVDAATAEAAVESTDGVAYLVASYQVPTGLAADDYTVRITLPNGNVQELGFTVE